MLLHFPLAVLASCFKLLATPTMSFEPELLKAMASHFQGNININDTGAVIASPGKVPALKGCCPGGYAYHWTRDGALSMAALIETGSVSGIDQAFVLKAATSYVRWVGGVEQLSQETEPKWNIATRAPYTGGWCRPQTDGPGLRARTLMLIAAQGLVDASTIWPLAAVDLDWIAMGDNYKLSSCDLWEETIDANFLWNRVSMRVALLRGAQFASAQGDTARAHRCDLSPI